jgi:hypothetical protein
MHDGFTVHACLIFSTSQHYILGYKTRKDIELKFYKSVVLKRLIYSSETGTLRRTDGR